MAWLPWWSVLGLMLALAITRGEGETRSVRVPLLLLGSGLGLALLLPGMRGVEGAIAFTQMFGRVMGAAALVSLAVSALEGGRAGWGALWLGALLLLGSVLPGAGTAALLGVGLLALVLTLLGAAGREARPFLRLGGGGRALLGVAGTALVGAALAGLLALAWPGHPAQSSPALPPAVTEQGREAGGAEKPNAPPPASAGRAPSWRPPASPRQSPPDLGSDLPLLGGLLLMLALLFMFLRGRAERWRAGERPRWWELLAVAGLLVAALLGIAFVFAAPGGGPGGIGGMAGAGGSAGPLGKLEQDALSRLGAQVLWWLGLLSFVVLAVLAGLVVWLALQLHPEPVGQAGEAEPAPAPPPTPPEALHRVRLAYRAALASLAAAGLGRGGTETPAEHADRATRSLPPLAAPLGTLVAAYAPVRYGGRVTEEDADAAEGAAREVARLTVDLKVAEPESETP